MMPPRTKRRRLNREEDGLFQAGPSEGSRSTRYRPGSPSPPVSIQDTISCAVAPFINLEDPLSGPETYNSFVPFDGGGSREPRASPSANAAVPTASPVDGGRADVGASSPDTSNVAPEPSTARMRAVSQNQDEAQERGATGQPAKPIQKATVSQEDEAALYELYVADPDVEMQLLEDRKDKIMSEAFRWILDTEQYRAFTSWEAGQQCRMLWVRGPAGTGKTMLVMGIVKLLKKHLPETQRRAVAHFFCQGTNDLFSAKASVLRSLLWQLLRQQPHLIHHAIEKFGHYRKPWFPADAEDGHSFVALSQVFQTILQDPGLEPCYVVVDALDECNGSVELLTQITDFVAITDKVKWLVSSRPEVVYATGEAHLSHFRVEIDSQVLEAPVRKYIEHKLSSFGGAYNAEVLEEMSKEINARAGNTFLWVWFVFQELSPKHKSGRKRVQGKPLDIIRQFPKGLEAAYRRIMDLIEEDDDSAHVDHCKHCLDAVYLAERPMTTREMAAILFISNEEMDDVILSCGSFLSTQRDNTINYFHQSAKDYLDKARFGTDDSSVWTHLDMARQSIQAMTTPRPGYKALHINMYNLDHFGPVDESKMKQCTAQEPLVSLRYACVHWAWHLGFHRQQYKTNGGTATGLDAIERLAFTFVEKHLLHWFEAVCFVQDSEPRIMYKISCMDDLNLPNSTILFARYCEIISKGRRAPLQVYLHAALFMQQQGNAWAYDNTRIASILGRDSPDRYQHLRIQAEDYGKADPWLRWPANQWRAAFQSDTINIWDLETGQVTQSYQLGEARHSAVEAWNDADLKPYRVEPDSVFSSNGQWFAATYHYYSEAINVWNLETRECIAQYNGIETHAVVALSSDGKKLALIRSEDVLSLHGLVPFTPLETFCPDVTHLLFSPDGTWLVCRRVIGAIDIWDVSTPGCATLVHKLRGCEGWIHSISFSVDSKSLAVRMDGSTTSVWDIESGEQLQPLRPSLPLPLKLLSLSSDYAIRDWLTVHGDYVLVSPNDFRAWFPASGNKISIVSKYTIVTMACECPSCQENFGQ